VKEIETAYPTNVRIAFRHFPLSFHKNAQRAAEAADCAQEQGKFWELHDILFENNRALEEEKLAEYAGQAGVDPAKFKECMDSGRTRQPVLDDMEAGKALGVRGTPAFFVNGIRLSGAKPFPDFKAVIDSELARAASK
jgi:protein-disulfide isomerase